VLKDSRAVSLAACAHTHGCVLDVSERPCWCAKPHGARGEVDGGDGGGGW